VKLLIVLTSLEYVRNYMSTSAFKSLDPHEVLYCFSSNVKDKIGYELASKIKLIDLPQALGSSINRLTFRLCSQIKMYEMHLSNPNFLFRLRRELVPTIYSLFVVPKRFFCGGGNRFLSRWPFRLVGERASLPFISVTAILKSLIFELPGMFRYILVMLLSRHPTGRGLTTLLWSRVPIDKGILSVLQEHQPQLIIIPSMAVDYPSYEWMRASARSSIGKVVLLIDNWDNLSSKTAFIRPPDFIGVMGEQGRMFAKTIHGVEESRITVLGTPRFDVYTRYRATKKTDPREGTSAPFRNPYILFAGCVAAFDEIGALKQLSDAVNRLGETLPKETRILYRPHPWGNRKLYLERLAHHPLFNVIVDPQIRQGNSLEGVNLQPDLNYYPELLANALMVVCPLSTMILESTIMLKRVIALAHEDGRSLMSPNRVFSNYRHFEGIERLENIMLLSDLNNLDKAIIFALQKGDLGSIPNNLDYFVGGLDVDYGKKLSMMINTIGNIKNLD